MGRGRASPCWALSRAGPVLVPRAEIAAQARPGLWHGHGTGLRGNRPGRVSAVLFRTGPVPARWARPIWLTLALAACMQCIHNVQHALHPKGAGPPAAGAVPGWRRCALSDERQSASVHATWPQPAVVVVPAGRRSTCERSGSEREGRVSC